MKRGYWPVILGVLAVLLLLGALAWYQQQKTRFDWEESSWSKKGYSETNDQPYGTQAFRALLDDYFSGKTCKNISKNVGFELPQDSTQRYNYVFVGEAMYLDSVSTQRLLDFVARGNTAFIASKSIPFDLMTFIYFEECGDAIWSDYASFEDSLVSASLITPTLPDTAYPLQYAQQNERKSYYWHYADEQFFCENLPQRVLGRLNGTHANYVSFPHGKGRFLLHTNPIAFSNYTLSKRSMRPYIAGVLSHLPEGDIYWDATSRVPEAVARRRNGSPYSGNNLEDDHLLSFILKQPALAWAWYLLAILTGLWLLFRAKRRRQIIPILPKNENTSYEFISTIAHLHFKASDFQQLCIQNMRLFLGDVRDRYNISIPMDTESKMLKVGEEHIRNLAMASKVPETQITNLFKQYEATVRYQPIEQMAVDLHQSIDHFWKTAK
ncbi:MAG: DUF4350 domain-containing protein [Saprospiraceae bacterium]|nr:DUF4350 domain-containing protein [Saprospiraceae bacterium]